MGVRITREIVESVKGYMKKYPNMSQAELSRLVGTSSTSVGSICKGLYDYLLEEVADSKEEKAKTLKADIPHETYRKLVCCELAIGELFDRAKISVQGGDFLFIDFKAVSSILERYFPEEYEKKFNELEAEDDSI
jgi:hypothetical protein